MNDVKTIVIHTYPQIKDAVKEMQECQEVLTDILSVRFPSEYNTETMIYAQDVLDGYCYVRNPYRLWVGRYVRYLDMTDAYRMHLKLGGFCVSDNGYTVKIRSNNNRIFSVSKRNRLWFMVINDTDLTRIQLNNLINS